MKKGFELILKSIKREPTINRSLVFHTKLANGVLVELCQEIVDNENTIPIGDEVWEDL